MPKEVIDMQSQGGVYVPISKPKQFLIKQRPKQNPKPPPTSQGPLDILDGIAAILGLAEEVRRRHGL